MQVNKHVNGKLILLTYKKRSKNWITKLYSYRDYQTDPSTIQTSWDVSGDPCPAVKYEWAIRRLDGLEISSFLDMGCKN